MPRRTGSREQARRRPPKRAEIRRPCEGDGEGFQWEGRGGKGFGKAGIFEVRPLSYTLGVAFFLMSVWPLIYPGSSEVPERLLIFLFRLSCFGCGSPESRLSFFCSFFSDLSTGLLGSRGSVPRVTTRPVILENILTQPDR